MAVRNVMHRLPQCPSAVAIRRIELLIRQPSDRLRNISGKIFDRLNKLRPGAGAVYVEFADGKSWIVHKKYDGLLVRHSWAHGDEDHRFSLR